VGEEALRREIARLGERPGDRQRPRVVALREGGAGVVGGLRGEEPEKEDEGGQGSNSGGGDSGA
jgi:hypothetical protein